MKAKFVLLGMILLVSCSRKEDGQFIYNRLNDVGKISGKITGKTDNLPVAGALVKIKNAADTAFTDQNGDFLIPEVAPGERVIYITKHGFLADSTIVLVTEMRTSDVDIFLSPDTIPPAFTLTGKWSGWIDHISYAGPMILQLQQIREDSVKGFMIQFLPGYPPPLNQDTVRINSVLSFINDQFQFDVYFPDTLCTGYLKGSFINQDSIGGIFFHVCQNNVPVTEPFRAHRN